MQLAARAIHSLGQDPPWFEENPGGKSYMAIEAATAETFREEKDLIRSTPFLSRYDVTQEVGQLQGEYVKVPAKIPERVPINIMQQDWSKSTSFDNLRQLIAEQERIRAMTYAAVAAATVAGGAATIYQGYRQAQLDRELRPGRRFTRQPDPPRKPPPNKAPVPGTGPRPGGAKGGAFEFWDRFKEKIGTRP